MPHFDDLFEVGAQGLVEQVFGQSCTLVRGSMTSDSFTARRYDAADSNKESNRVPEVGDFYFWEFAVADCKRSTTLIRPKVNDEIHASNYADNTMAFVICASETEQAVAFTDQEKRYRVRTQYVQG